jgi:hypothetical protein
MKKRAVMFVPLLLCLFVLLGSQTTAQKTKSSEFRTGQLVKIENVTDFMKQSEKAGYLLTIQDGAEQYFAHYTMTYFGHDRSKDMDAGKDIQYRIDGKHLFVKSSNGEEIKMRLCQQEGNWVKCGSFAASRPPDPSRK